MPYEVTCAEGTTVSVLKSNGEIRDLDGKLLGYDHYSELHDHGDQLSDEEISPVVIKLFEEGDKHTLSWLRRVGKPGPKAKRPEVKDETLDPEVSPLRDQAERHPTAQTAKAS